MGGGTSKNDVEIATINKDAMVECVKLEWEAKKEMELAKIDLEKLKTNLDSNYKLKIEENKKLKSEFRCRAHTEVYQHCKDMGLEVQDIAAAVTITSLSLKDELVDKERDIWMELVKDLIRRKATSNRANNGNIYIPENQLLEYS